VSAAAPSGRAPDAAPAELLRFVRRLALRTRGRVTTRFAGEYASVFKGQGMEFAEVREYQPGDEVRSIDWNVTARMRRPFVKRFVEERERTVLLLVDVSGSAGTGTGRRVKHEAAVEVCAALALLAVQANDRVGAVLASDRVEAVIPPRKGRRHALRILRDLVAHQPAERATDLAAAMEHLRRALRHRSIVFVVSDFAGGVPERATRLLAARHDVIFAAIEDPGERRLPSVGPARLRDPETGRVLEIDTDDAAVQARYAAAFAAERAARQALCRRLAIDELLVRTHEDVRRPLALFFRARERRRRH
jgi:uncharacterized protein (DUF58 family)